MASDGLVEGAEEKLRAYAELLETYALPLGLLAPGDADRIWERHVLDSLRALPCLTVNDRALVDLGSGAGLPGIPVAIARPQADVFLVEPMRRRAAFLELAVERLKLGNAHVRIQEARSVREDADVVLARALRGAREVWSMASPILRPGGRVLYFAGGTWEIREAATVSEGGATVSICSPPLHPWQGPVVMMTRADTSGTG